MGEVRGKRVKINKRRGKSGESVSRRADGAPWRVPCVARLGAPRRVWLARRSPAPFYSEPPWSG